MAAPAELPMAIADCGLDQTALQEQLGRYRRLGEHGEVRRSSPLALTVDFAHEPDAELVQSTIAVERGCCAFFALDYVPARRRLTVSVADGQRTAALDAIEAALRGPAQEEATERSGLGGSGQEEATEPSRPHTGHDS
jgi:hypothetical protein